MILLAALTAVVACLWAATRPVVIPLLRRIPHGAEALGVTLLASFFLAVCALTYAVLTLIFR